MSTKKQNKLKSFRSKMLESRQQSLDFFSGLEYRYESVGFINGCEVINDSKATDLESTLLSLEMTKTPVHLILGSTDVENLVDYLGKELRLKVVTLSVFGEVDFTKKVTISNLVDKTVYSQKLDELVPKTINWLKAGETLLFSPACASFEWYNDFKQRALHFNKIVEPYLNSIE